MALVQLFFFLFFSLMGPDGSMADDRTFICTSSAGTYEPNSTYHSNLNLLLSNLASRTPIDMSLTTSQGISPDQVFGVANCVDRQKNSTCPTCPDTICKACMDAAKRDVPAVCPLFKEASGRFPDCLMKYSNKPITGPMTTGSPGLSDPASTPQGSNGTATTKAGTSAACEKTRAPAYMVALAVAGGFLLFVLVLVVVGTLLLRRNLRSATPEIEATYDDPNMRASIDDYGVLRTATQNFAESNVIGSGAFGCVYKGTLRGGQVVAIKTLLREGDDQVPRNSVAHTQLLNELDVVNQLNHRNLVRSLGFCLHEERIMLVYEYLRNSSLDTFLSINSSKAEKLNWETRFRIIRGITEGLLYLHDKARHTTIHRDLKTSNILLDRNMNAKISDFGLARIFTDQQTHRNTRNHAGTV